MPDAPRAPRKPLHEIVFGLLKDVSPTEWVIACAALLFVVQFGLLPRDAFFSPDEGMRIIVSRNLRPDSIFTGLINYENRQIDPRLEFVPYFDQWYDVAPGVAPGVAPDRELRISYPIVWFAALIAPLQAVGGVNLVQVFSLICGAMAGFLASRVLLNVAGKGAAILGVIAVMLALPSSLYSFLVWEHQLVLALCLLALACYVESETGRRKWLVVVGGGAILFACALRVETLFVVAPALFWMGWERVAQARVSIRRRLLIIGGAMAGIALLAGVYGFVAQDSPYRLPELAPALEPAQLERSVVPLIHVFIGYDASAATCVSMLLVIGAGGLALLIVRRRPAACAVAGAAILVAATIVTALSVFRVEPFRVVNPGLLCGAPLLVLAILPAGSMVTTSPRLRFLRRALVLVCVGFAVGAVLTPRLAGRAGHVLSQVGSTWGSRYLLAMYPLMAIVALAGLVPWMHAESRERKIAKWGAAGLRVAVGLSLAMGMLVNTIGLTRIQTDKNIVLPGCQAMWRTSARVVVTDDWWRAPECAARPYPAYLLTQSPNVLPQLRRVLFDARMVKLAYASQTNLVSLETLIGTLDTCFSVARSQSYPGERSGNLVELALLPRPGTCSD